MIQVGSLLEVTDKTGVVLGQCIKVFGAAKKRIAKLGEVVLISVRWNNIRRLKTLKFRLRRRYAIGSLHRALIIRTRFPFRRGKSCYISFDVNEVVLVNKRTVPMSNRVYGPVMKELCMKWPSLGCVSRMIF